MLFSMSLAVRETIRIVREIGCTRKVQSVSSPSSLLSSHSYSVNIWQIGSQVAILWCQFPLSASCLMCSIRWARMVLVLQVLLPVGVDIFICVSILFFHLNYRDWSWLAVNRHG